MSKLVIGLTGGIGSGKTTVTDYFQNLGIDIIDADIIAREVVAINTPALSAIKQHFGDEFIQTDGQLNRSLLRQRIFSNESDKQWLSNLLHPLIRQTIIEQTQAANSVYCILAAPLLIENNLQALVDLILVVDVKESTQVKRTLLRDDSSEAVVRSIISSQATRKERLKAADDIIDNDNVKLPDIEKRVQVLDKKYLTLTKMRQKSTMN